MKKVFLIEDDADLANELKLNLEALSLSVKVADNLSTSRAMLNNERFDLIIMDFKIKHDLTTDKLLSELKGGALGEVPNVNTPLVICSGTLDAEAVLAFKSRTTKILVKPFGFQKIKDILIKEGII